MNFPHLIGVRKDSARVADSVWRLIKLVPWWIANVLGAIGIIVAAFGAIVGTVDTWEAAYLAVIALGWLVISAFWAKLAKSSIRSNSEMINEYEHLFAHVMEMNTIIKDSLEALSTYDRDRAVELAHDLNTLTSKSLYNSYWRGDPREKGEVEHE